MAARGNSGKRPAGRAGKPKPVLEDFAAMSKMQQRDKCVEHGILQSHIKGRKLTYVEALRMYVLDSHGGDVLSAMASAEHTDSRDRPPQPSTKKIGRSTLQEQSAD